MVKFKNWHYTKQVSIVGNAIWKYQKLNEELESKEKQLMELKIEIKDLAKRTLEAEIKSNDLCSRKINYE